MSGLDCAEVAAHLESYRRGDASRDLALLVDEHLARCPECRRQLAHMKQVSAMLSAWRPQRVPAELKIEVADAVSDALGVEARKALARPRRRARRQRPATRRLSAPQRAANFLALAALLFLGTAIAWRLWQRSTDRSPAGQPTGPAVAPQPEAEGTVTVRLVRCGPETDEVVARLCERFGLSQQEAEMLIDRAPVTLQRGVTQAEAEATRKLFDGLDVQIEARPTREPRDRP